MQTLSAVRTFYSAISVILLIEPCFGTTWSCAVNTKTSGAQIEQYQVSGKMLKELTSDKLMHELDPSSHNFMGWQYNILLDNRDALIAESNTSNTDDQKQKEIEVTNIIITKQNGNLIKTTILTHLPSPDEIDTVKGSCVLNTSN